MTNMFKALIIAVIGATALTTQVSSVYAMGSDRDPTSTNTFETNAAQLAFVPQKNRVSIVAGSTVSPVNAFFLTQR